MLDIEIANISARALLKSGASRGIDTNALLRNIGLCPKLLEDSGARIPLRQVLKLSEEVCKLSGDQNIGLMAAQELPFGAYKTLDYMAVASSTMAEAAASASRHFGLVTNAFGLVIWKRRELSVLEIRQSAGHQAVPGHYGGYILASLLLRFQLSTGVCWWPREVHLTSPVPQDTRLHQQVFRAPMRFGQPRNRLIIDGDVLRLSQPYADAALRELLQWHSQRLLKKLPNQDQFLGTVRQILDDGLRAGDIRLGSSARKLAISRRSLQRRLKHCGVSYREILDQQRQQLAVELLRGAQIDIAELSFLLGFSEQSSFYRWFKKYTGKTPLEYLQSFV
jgi:AraC-like DNA-binding protein